MRALLIHAGAVGDFVLSLSIVDRLRAMGATHVDVLGKAAIARLAAPGGGVDAVMDIDSGGGHLLFGEESLSIPAPLQNFLGEFDLAVNTLAGRAGLRSTRLIEAGVARVLELDPRPRAGWRGHITEQWMADLTLQDRFAPVIGPSVLKIDETMRVAGQRRLKDLGIGADRPFAVIQPGSGSRQKCWPLPQFLELSRHLGAGGWTTIFLLGPVEREWWGDAEVEALRNAGPVLESISLNEAAAVINECGLFVGNDSGMSHVAAALGVATLAIFGPTDPVLWRPLGRTAAVASTGVVGQWPSVEDVVKAIQRLLNRPRPR